MNNPIEENIENPVAKAIDIAGGQARLAQKCNVYQQTVSKWLKKGFVPFNSVGKVVNAINGQVSAEELCPQIKKAMHSSGVVDSSI